MSLVLPPDQPKKLRSGQTGMTLIELLFFIVLVGVFAYVSFISLKPSLQFWRVGHVLGQVQHLVMGMQAYHSLYGAWPDQENNCTNALSAVQALPVKIMAQVEQNTFGSPISVSCTGSQVLSPMLITQSVPRKFLSYYQRWLYQVEVPDSIPEDPEAMVEINSKIPPSQGTNRTYFAQMPFGRDIRTSLDPSISVPVAPVNNGAASTQLVPVTLADIALSLADNQAWISKPLQCEGAEQINIGVSPNSLCTGLAPSERVAFARYPFSGSGVYRASTSANAEDFTFTGSIEVTRTLVIMGVDKNIERCVIRQSGALACDPQAVADNEFHGWRVSVDQTLDFRYNLRYVLEDVSLAGENLSGLLLDVDQFFASRLGNEVDAIQIRVFNWGLITEFLSRVLSESLVASISRLVVNQEFPEDLTLLEVENLNTTFGNCGGIVVVDRVIRLFEQRLQAFIQCAQ